jgi:hypothetical protein
MTYDRINDLIGKLRRVPKSDNALDIAVEIALFKPDDRHVSVGINAAGTKLIYRRHDGKTDTFRALDHTLNADTRASAIAALQNLAGAK